MRRCLFGVAWRANLASLPCSIAPNVAPKSSKRVERGLGRVGCNSCFRQRRMPGLHQASLLVRCHAPQYRHLYVLSCVGAVSSAILCTAVAFASFSLAYIRLPDTGQVRGSSRFTAAASQEGLVLRCLAAILNSHWVLPEGE